MKKLFSTAVIFLVINTLHAQYAIQQKEGYSPQVGTLVGMLDDMKHRVTRSIKDLDQEETDFLLDDNSNRFGAMILHLAATEMHYQYATFYNSEMGEEVDKEWIAALNLGDEGRKQLQGKPMSYYLEKWDQVRAKTKEVLMTKNDDWLLEMRDDWGNVEYNYYWAWYHVMEHQANHLGQFIILKKEMKKATD